MLIVLDTTSWIQTRLLGTVVASALIHKIRTEKSQLVLSDFQRRKIEITATRKLHEHESLARKNLDVIKQYMGQIEKVGFPREQEVKARISTKLSEIGSTLRQVDCTDAQKLSAAARVLEQTPPNSPRSQQYKDSMIWETVLDLVDVGDVMFVSKDKGFYEGGDYKKGLVSNLKDDIAGKSYSVTLYQEISDYLDKQSLREQDKEQIINSLESFFQSMPDRILSFGSRDFLNPVVESCELNAFLTEKLGLLAIDFDVILHTDEFYDYESDVDSEGRLRMEGSATWEPSAEKLDQVVPDKITIFSPDGQSAHVYSYMSSSTGGRVDRHVFRKPI